MWFLNLVSIELGVKPQLPGSLHIYDYPHLSNDDTKHVQSYEYYVVRLIVYTKLNQALNKLVRPFKARTTIAVSTN